MRRMVWVLSGAGLLLAACGGDAAPDTTAATEAPAATTTTAAADVGVVPMDVSPCALVTVEEVAAAAGLQVVESGADGPISCVFDFGEQTGVAIFLNIDDGEGRFGAPASVFESYMATEGAESIPGLGEAAVYVQGFRGLAVDAGDGRYIGLGVNGGYGELAEPRDVLVELAAAALGRL